MPAARAYVYIVACADGSWYTGTARDVAARLATHNLGKGAKYTRSRGPVTLAYQEGPMTVGRALRREYQLKQLTRPQKAALIAGTLVLALPRRPARKRQTKTAAGKPAAVARKTGSASA